MISSFAWSDSAPSNGAHWNGVQGLGTNEEIDNVRRPKGRPDASLTARGHPCDRLAERLDAAVSHGAVHLPLEAEAASAPTALAHLEKRHVAVLGVRRFHRRDRLERVHVSKPSLDDHLGCPVA